VRIVAIDQGTTSTRALSFGAGGAWQVTGSKRHETRYPKAGWVEQDAGELLANIGELLQGAGTFDAIALANQGETCMAWDAGTGEALSPVIVWQDTRTSVLLEAMTRDGVDAEVADRAALPLDPYFSAAKLGWIMRNVPAARAAHTAGRLRVGTTDAFFLDRLTGAFATDRATASRTSLMNIETGAWDPDLCRIFGVPIECLPEIRTNIADFGLFKGKPLAASIVDQQAALYGHGCREAGDAKITFGTGAFALTVTGVTPPREGLASGLVPTVAWDLGAGAVYALDGGVQDAGAAIEWAIRAGLAANVEDFNTLPQRSAIERGLVFVPAFSGLGCPFWDRSASPLLIGLRPDMSRADICQALLEGIAFLTAEVVDAMRKSADIDGRVSIDGGLSRNPYFVQFLADCSKLEIVVDGFVERTAFGAAALAAKALGQDLRSPSANAVGFRPRKMADDLHRRFRDGISRTIGWSVPS
jgi:glycerol kinase